MKPAARRVLANAVVLKKVGDASSEQPEETLGLSELPSAVAHKIAQSLANFDIQSHWKTLKVEEQLLLVLQSLKGSSNMIRTISES